MTMLLFVFALAPGLPTASQTATMLRDAAEHPRLFFAASEVPALQTKATTVDDEVWRPILAYSTSNLQSSPPAAPPSPGALNEYRNFGNQLIPLAFSCVITERSDLCELARRYLLQYAQWNQWGEGNVVGLGLAHMVAGNAIAYDWLHPILTVEERARVRSSLAQWSALLYEASANQTEWWHSSYLQNFYWTTHSALGLAGLALLDEDARAQQWLDHVVDKLGRGQDFLAGIGDGSWHESIAYQQQLLSTTLPFLVSLRHVQGIDLLPHRYLRAYPYWMLYTYIPNVRQFALPYGDFEWDWFGVLSHLLRFSAAEYRNGYAEWLSERYTADYGRMPGVWSAPWYVFELLFHDPAVTALSPADLHLHRVFSDLQGVVWRTGWEGDDLVFGLKTGSYGGRFAFDTFVHGATPWNPPCAETGCQLNVGHNHDDTNSFYLNRAGRWLAPETVGVDKYDTSYHNTLLIDGQGQARPPAGGYSEEPQDFAGTDGFIEDTADSEHYDYVAADATNRYSHAEGITDVTRHVLFARPDYFLMLDTIAANTEHQYEWVSHFGETVSSEPNWLSGAAGDGQILGVNVVAPSQYNIRYGNDGYPYAAISPPKPVQDLRFLNLLAPTDSISWASRPSAQLVEDTGTAIQATVTSTREGRIDDILINYAPPAKGDDVPAPETIDVGNYRTDGRVAVISKPLEGGDPTRLFLHGGTFLTDLSDNLKLIGDIQGARDVEIAYSDNEVAVVAQGLTSITIWLPAERNLKINGVTFPFVRSGEYARNGEYVTARVLPLHIPLLLRAADKLTR